MNLNIFTNKTINNSEIGQGLINIYLIYRKFQNIYVEQYYIYMMKNKILKTNYLK